MLIQCEFMITLNSSACTMCCYTTNRIISCYFKHLLDIPTSQFRLSCDVSLLCWPKRCENKQLGVVCTKYKWNSHNENCDRARTKQTKLSECLKFLAWYYHPLRKFYIGMVLSLFGRDLYGKMRCYENENLICIPKKENIVGHKSSN